MTTQKKSEKPHVYVSIVGCNCQQWIAACLSSVLASDYDNFSVLFVDNASQDQTAQIVAKDFPQVHLIHAPENLGFGRAHNLALDHMLEEGADYIILLNVDTTVDPNWIDGLVEAAESHPEYCMLMPLQYDYQGEKLDAHFDNCANRNPNWAKDYQEGNLKKVYTVSTAVGAAMMFRRKIIEDIGLFDPHFFAYGEESDWVQRAQLSGHEIAIAPHGAIRHWHTHINTDQSYAIPPEITRYHQLRGQFLLFLKNPNRHFLRNLYGYFRTAIKLIGSRNGQIFRQNLSLAFCACSIWYIQTTAKHRP